MKKNLASLRSTVVYDAYWRFAAERQEIFFRRLEGAFPWTGDEILLRHKFTNAYRASDRVSQYLIRNILYDGEQTPVEIFFRTILFKLFNRIETWELLMRSLGAIRFADFDVNRYDDILTHAMSRGERLYSAAYIMPTAAGFEGARKHSTHLRLLEKMIREELPQRIADTASMEEAFKLLRSYPMMGDFLAYQYITDLNYSILTNFDEAEFVVAGPGARDGIQKCFGLSEGWSAADVIRFVAEHQTEEFRKRGIAFKSLWGRPLQLIDCQNLFCEVDKYARVAHPEVKGITGRQRIKQVFSPKAALLPPWYPPKWGLNEQIIQDAQRWAKQVSTEPLRTSCQLTFDSSAKKTQSRYFEAKVSSTKMQKERLMKFDDYQKEAKKTNVIKSTSESARIASLFGLAGEVGELLGEFKKQIRNPQDHILLNARIEEELGDILWYLSETATKNGLDLGIIAKKNLEKAKARFARRSYEEHKLFDDTFPEGERFPRHFEITFEGSNNAKRKGKTLHGAAVVAKWNEEPFGDSLTDNNYYDDGYRYHDVFHLAYVACLGWSPVTRKFLKRKRVSDRRTDEVEDGGRAQAIEEGVAALVHAYAIDHAELRTHQELDSSLLRTIAMMVNHLEVSARTTGDWENAIRQGYRVWHELREKTKGRVIVDILNRKLTFEP